MIIKEILGQLILEKGVNVSDVVRDTGLSPTPIYAILKGEAKRPLSSTIKKLADYFGVPPKYLLTGEVEGQPAQDDTTLAARVAALEKRVDTIYRLADTWRKLNADEKLNNDKS